MVGPTLLGVLLGCGGAGYESIDLHGVVTIDGEPVPKGQVTFAPANNGPVVGAEIVQGKYECNNVPLGKCRASFVAQAAEMKTIPIPATGGTGEVPINILPPKYAAGIEKEITPEASELNFELTSE
jgi:hypothetical protein